MFPRNELSILYWDNRLRPVSCKASFSNRKSPALQILIWRNMAWESVRYFHSQRSWRSLPRRFGKSTSREKIRSGISFYVSRCF